MTKKVWDGWTQLDDGGSGTWTWVREVSPLRFLFIRIDDAVDACGAGADTQFYADTNLVDLGELDPADVAKAISGLENDEPGPMWIAYCCRTYGLHAPLWSGDSGPMPTDPKRRSEVKWNRPSDTSPMFIRLASAARKAAETFLAGDESALDRVVNAVGQTAREYAQGISGLWAALERIKNDSEASAEQKTVLRMYQKCEHTLSGDTIPPTLRNT